MRQANVQISAPGFLGINTEESPTNLNLGWCAIADNAIIDANGRIASRKGYRTLTTDVTALGSEAITQVHEARYADGTDKRFATGNLKIFEFDASGVLTDITPASPGITADDWQIVTLNDDTFFVQREHETIVYDKSADTCSLISNHANVAGTPPEAHAAVAAYGRLWTGGVQGQRATLYWSDLLIGPAANSGTAGSLDLTQLWPSGNDEITAIAAHNQKLIVFGKESILIFGSSNSDGRLADPANDLFFEDGIVDIGCVGKHAWEVIGNDLWFVDFSGLRSLGRTIQEKSLPIGDLSRNVNTLFRNQARTEDGGTRVLYSPDEAFVLVMFPGQGLIRCFDTRQRLQDGSARTTNWVGLPFVSMGRAVDGTLWFGSTLGINRYTGYVDKAAGDGTGGEKYRFRYYTHPQDFGEEDQTNAVKLKLPKQADFIIAGGLGQRATCYWGFGYRYLFKRQPFVLDAQTPDFYNIDEFNITTTDDPNDPTEYGSGGTIGEYTIPLNGSGPSLSLGLEVNVLGQQLSVQEINIQTKIGRII